MLPYLLLIRSLRMLHLIMILRILSVQGLQCGIEDLRVSLQGALIPHQVVGVSDLSEAPDQFFWWRELVQMPFG
jgi:hypothetical protein